MATGADWLTCSQFAALSGVSERTARRRCEKGQVRARRETTSKGVVWLIDPLEVRPSAAKGAAIGQSIEGETEQSNGCDVAGASADGAANVRPSADTSLLAHVLEENRKLWGVIEQLQRDGAETRAALRELTKAMPKQLTTGAPSTHNRYESETARNGQEQHQSADVGNHNPEAPNGQGIKPGREVWAPSNLDELADLLEREINR